MKNSQLNISYLIFLFLLGLFSALSSMAQEILVEGSAEMLIVDTKLMKQYEYETSQWAINNALYNTFGSSVNTNYETITETEIEGRSVLRHSNIRTNYINTYPNGVWIRQDTEPEYDAYKDAKGNWWLRCSVKGWAKEMPSTKVEFIAKTLDGTDFITDESTQFISGERGYIYFRSSTAGYLNIFFDDFMTVQRCLPYNNMDINMFPIKANTDYIFFDTELSGLPDNNYIVDEIELYTDKELEYNQFYILFSKKEMNTPVLNDEQEIEKQYFSFKSMEREGFHQWLQQSRLLNEDLQVHVVGVTIKGIK